MQTFPRNPKRQMFLLSDGVNTYGRCVSGENLSPETIYNIRFFDIVRCKVMKMQKFECVGSVWPVLEVTEAEFIFEQFFDNCCLGNPGGNPVPLNQ
jgi:hypothetical protein